MKTLRSICCVLLVVFITWHQVQTAAQSTKPNIIFILADDYGYHDIGYHNSEIKTPNLDQLAAEGVKLDNYYVQPLCSPTRSQLLSGRYQIHTGMQHGVILSRQPKGLPLGHPTLADKMKAAGYATHMIGKWHLGFYKIDYVPTRRGFDTFYGYYGGSETYFGHETCQPTGYNPTYNNCGHHFPHGGKVDETARGNKTYFGHQACEHRRDNPSNNTNCGYDFRDGEKVDETAKGKYSTHLFTERAVNIVKNHSPSKPMFMYLAFQAVHYPLEVPEYYTKQYSHITDNHRKTYAGMTTCMDEAVGNLTKALKAKNMLDNTILIFSSDNGGSVQDGANNWPLRGMKATLWEGGIRAIGFVHAKGLKHPGTVNKALIHVTDWYPTLVKLAQGSLSGTPLDGFDQWATISEGKPSPRNEILHNIDPLVHKHGQPMDASAFDNSCRAAIRVGQWKLITGNPGNGSWIAPPNMPGKTALHSISASKNLWLFDIGKDPEERNDVSHLYTGVVKNLLDKLNAYNATAVAAIFPPGDPKSNPKNHGGVWGPWE